MNFAASQRNPRQNLIGVLLVFALHAVLFYGLVNGLGQRVVDVIKEPMLVALIAEPTKPVPPPAPPKPAAAPKTVTPPPAVVPPPEVRIPAPPPPDTISVTPAPLPPRPLAVTPQPPQPKSRLRVGVNPIYIPPVEELQRRYPRQARREGISGRVVMRLTIAPGGNVVDAVVLDAQPPRVFDAVALDYVRRFRFDKGTDEFFVDQEIIFKLD